MSFASAVTAASISDGPKTASSTGSKPGTRTWAEAEENKRRLEARLTGHRVAEDP